MIKFHKCNICRRRFKADEIGRIQIVKRLPKGKKEFWLCSNCTKIFVERVKDILPIKIEEDLYEKSKNEQREEI